MQVGMHLFLFLLTLHNVKISVKVIGNHVMTKMVMNIRRAEASGLFTPPEEKARAENTSYFWHSSQIERRECSL